MTVTLKQAKVTGTFSGAGPHTLSFGSACTSGTRIVAMVTLESAAAPTSVADGTNGSYTQDGSGLSSYWSSGARIYSIANTGTSALTVTLTLPGSNVGTLTIFELDACGAADVAVGVEGSDFNLSVTATTTEDNCAMFVCGAVTVNVVSSVDSEDGGYTAAFTSALGSGKYHIGEYNLNVGSAAAKTMNFDLGAVRNGSWVAVAYKTTGAGGGSFTIAADQGTFTHTGQAANLLFGRKLTADFGSFVLSGQDVTLTKTTAYSITADYGSFSLAGQDVAFQKTDAGSYVLTAEVGLFSLVGQGALASYSMNAEIGSFVIAGQEVTFSIGVPAAYSLTADAGSYSLTGQNARLDWSGAPIVPNRQAGIYMGMRIGL